VFCIRGKKVCKKKVSSGNEDMEDLLRMESGIAHSDLDGLFHHTSRLIKSYAVRRRKLI